MKRKLTIGELSRRTGVSVRKLRFYSDEGLLPPAARSDGGYRLYTEAHIARIHLVRTLREAGLGLEDIGKVLRRDVTLERALALRLEAVEAHIAGLERVASALKVAIRSGATEDNLRRVTMVTRASNEERRRVVAAFYDKVLDGIPAEGAWREAMIDAAAPPLSDPPTPEQLAAWVELEMLLDDPTFVETRRASAVDTWSPPFDRETFGDAQYAALTEIRAAREGGFSPTSSEGRALVERVVVAISQKVAAHDASAVRAHLRTKFDPRGARFWELVAIVRNDPATMHTFDDWRWFGEALGHPAAA